MYQKYLSCRRMCALVFFRADISRITEPDFLTRAKERHIPLFGVFSG